MYEARKKLAEEARALILKAAKEKTVTLNQLETEKQYYQPNYVYDYKIKAQDQIKAARGALEAEYNYTLASLYASRKDRTVKGRQEWNNYVKNWSGRWAELSVKWDEVQNNVSKALGDINENYRIANDKVEKDYEEAVHYVNVQQETVLKSIIQQETLPLIHHVYRKVLGRDPTKEEAESWLKGIKPAAFTITPPTKKEYGLYGWNNIFTGEKYSYRYSVVDWGKDFTDYYNLELSRWLEGARQANKGTAQMISDALLQSDEYKERQKEVSAIKQNVIQFLEEYLNSGDDQKKDFHSMLGLSENETVTITNENLDQFAQYFQNQSLHFGQSAFNAVEYLLKNKNISSKREDLASKLILTDILTGVLDPSKGGDLEISMFSIQRFARNAGLDLRNAQANFEELRASNQPLMALINKNHYVVITDTKDGSVSYIDTGIGPDGQNSSITISKDEFLKIWEGYVICQADASLTNPLTDEVSKALKGAYFGNPFGWVSDGIRSMASFAYNAVTSAINSLARLTSSAASFFVNTVGGVFNSVVSFSNILSNSIYKFFDVVVSSAQRIAELAKSIVTQFTTPLFDLPRNLFNAVKAINPFGAAQKSLEASQPIVFNIDPSTSKELNNTVSDFGRLGEAIKNGAVKQYFDDGTQLARFVKDGRIEKIELYDNKGVVSTRIFVGAGGTVSVIDNLKTNTRASFLDQGKLTLIGFNNLGFMTNKNTFGALDALQQAVSLPIINVEQVLRRTKDFIELTNQIFMFDGPQTIIHKNVTGEVTAVDMKLDWLNFMEEDKRLLAIEDVFNMHLADWRWSRAIADAVPNIVETMKIESNRFIFVPGVNTTIVSQPTGDAGRTMSQVEALSKSFNINNQRVMFLHSAGTEAGLRALIAAKKAGVDLSQFKFVFASPRVRRDTFIDYLNRAGVASDQVLVVTAAGDFRHWPTDFLSLLVPAVKPFLSSIYDYENNKVDGNIQYNYLFLEKDLTFEADREHVTEQLKHGGMVDGSDHEYQLVKNGTRITRVRLKDVYLSLSDGSV